MFALFFFAASALSVAPRKADPSPTDCLMCKTAVSLVKSYLENEQDVQKIIEKLESFCSYCKPEVQDICKQLVDEKVPEIIKYIDDKLDGEQICKILDMCE